MTGFHAEPRNATRAHRHGRVVLAMGIGLGIALAGWLAGWFGPTPEVLSQNFAVPASVDRTVPGPRQGLVLTTENRGQVLFGRSCDSCHTAGRQVLGSSLRSPDFKRRYPDETSIRNFVRNGGFDMPSFSREFLSDEDLKEIVRYVLSLSEEPL